MNSEWMNIWIEWSTWKEFVSTCQAGCSYDGFNSRGGKDRQGDSVEISKTTGLGWVRMSCEYLGVIQFSSYLILQPHILCWHVRYGPCALFPPKAKNDFSRKKHWGSSDFAAHVLFKFRIRGSIVRGSIKTYVLLDHEKRGWDDTTCFVVQFVPYSLSYLFHIYWTEQGIRSIP